MENIQNQSLLKSVFAVFPGQGSQHVGMGKDLFQNFAIARETFEEASDAIHVDLKKLCFEGPDSDLVLTENTQPCLLVSSVAAYRVAEKEYQFTPAAVAGHSLGEYSALVAIGSLDLTTATRWVKERGIAMQKAVPSGEGTMAAILGLEDERVKKLCEIATQSALAKQPTSSPNSDTITIVEPANFNAPGQVVIAGSTTAVQEAIQILKSSGDFSGGKAIPLQVSAPFHCKLMSPARQRMAELFAQAKPHERAKPLSCSYIPNRTARLSREPNLVFELLVEQVDHPVLWKQSIETLLDAQMNAAIEFGPGKVLSGLIKRISSASGKTCALTSVSDSASVLALETLIQEKIKLDINH
ncbi:[acyl-carrier-protein] S-malonyltransferase [bacterium]|jgi:[acyl-carrier-protein] S-malonyltransferase|nr:[acyl-carrier-protein] S-malonyltransferase [bacterium]